MIEDWKAVWKCPKCRREETLVMVNPFPRPKIYNWYARVQHAWNKVIDCLEAIINGGSFASDRPGWVNWLSWRFFLRFHFPFWKAKLGWWCYEPEAYAFLYCRKCKIQVWTGDFRDHVRMKKVRKKH